MKQQKRIFRKFSYRECDAFAAFLHEQSLKGWHFKEWKMGLIFERGEEADALYDVQVFPKGKESDFQPEEDAREYADYCEAAGWKLIDGKGRFCIFRQCGEEVTPIVTEEEKFQNICKVERWEWLKEILCYALLAGLFSCEYILWPISAKSLYENDILCVVAIALIRFLWRMADGIWLLVWNIRQKKRLAAGERVTYDKGGLQKRIYVNLREYISLGILFLLMWQAGYRGVVALLFIFMVVIAGTELLFSYLRPKREIVWMMQTGQVIAIVFMMFVIVIIVVFGEMGMQGGSIDAADGAAKEPPLSQEDYKDVEGQRNVADYFKRKGVLGEMLCCRVEYEPEWEEPSEEELARMSEEEINQLKMRRIGETDTLSYEIYQSEYAWVLDKTWKTEAKGYELEDCTEQWGAVYAGLQNSYRYLVRYEDAVWVIEVYEGALSDEQIRIVREQLDKISWGNERE